MNTLGHILGTLLFMVCCFWIVMMLSGIVVYIMREYCKATR